MKSAAISDLMNTPAGQDDVDTAVMQIAWTLPGPTTADRSSNARIVVDAIFWGYLRALDPATAQAYARLDDKINRLAVAAEAERDRHDARVSFDDTLLRFPPTLRDLALQVRESWPRIEVVARDLANPAARPYILSQWADAQPGWMAGASIDALVWLALLAAGYEGGEIAFRFWELALSRGLYPRGLGVAYAALSIAASDEDGARRYLDGHGDEHPLCAAVRAAMDHAPDAVISALERWEPAELHYRSQKDVMIAAGYLEANDTGRAITRAIAAWDQYQSSTAALLAARALLVRAWKLGAVAKVADAERAVELAVAARDMRNTWGGDSAEAVEVAVSALHLLHNPERVWVLTQPPPAGEASVEEAQDSRIAAHAAMAAALTGRIDAAKERLGSLSGFAKAHIEAVISEWTDNSDSARDAWQRSWDSATNDLERIQAASGLVHAGAGVPELGTTRDAFPDVAAELDALAEALAAPDPITHLRAKSTSSPVFLVEFAARLRADGQSHAAAKALDEGATRWGDAVLAAMAAREFAENGSEADAILAARHAMDIGGPNWSRRRQMLALIVEAEAGRQHWTDAVAAARQMVTENPGDLDADWALTMALFNSSEPEKAWDALTRTGKALRPRRKTEVMLWLRLNSRYAEDAGFIDDAFEIVANWSEDESVFGTLVQVMSVPGNLRADVSDEQAASIRRSVEEFTQRFPKSAMLRVIAAGPDENPLAPMEALLREGAERNAEIAKQAQDGTVPLGLLSVVANRSYAEASLRRAANGVLAEFASRPPDETAAAAQAKTRTCVVDATTAHTLALMDEPTRTLLLGTCSSVVTTDAAYRDALTAREALRSRSTMTVGWNTETDRPIVTEISEEQAAELAAKAEMLVAILSSVRREPHPTLSHFPAEFDKALPSLGLVDVAKSNGYVLWSDDRVLRRLAASMGVSTFGTLALLDSLASAGTLHTVDHAMSAAKLLTSYYAEIPFSEEVYKLAFELDGRRPGGVASSLSNAAVWTNAEATFAFAQACLGTSASTDPYGLRVWCGLIAAGLLAMASDDSEMGANNLSILLARCLSEPWCTASALPFVLGGLRDAMQRADGVPLRDPLEGVLRSVHRVAVKQLGDTGAKSYLLGLVAQCGGDDKQTAARVILTAPRR